MKCADSKKDKTPNYLADESFIPPELIGNNQLNVVFSPGSMKEMAYKTFDNLVDKDIMKLIEITRIKGAGDPYLSFYTDKVIHDCGPLFDGNGKAPKLTTRLRGDPLRENPKRVVTWGAKIDTSSTSGGEAINSEFNKKYELYFDKDLMYILGYIRDCSLIVPLSKLYNDYRNLPNWKDVVDPEIDFRVNGESVVDNEGNPNMLRRAVGIKSKAMIENTYIKSLGDGIVATEIVSEGFQVPGSGTSVTLTGLT